MFIIIFRRSLDLIECLLPIVDTSFYPNVLEIFRHEIQHARELIFLALIQLHKLFYY